MYLVILILFTNKIIFNYSYIKGTINKTDSYSIILTMIYHSYIHTNHQSFCTICTYPCHRDLIGLLLSLSIHHPNEIIYCMTDTKTKDIIDTMINFIRLTIIWDVF